MLLKPKNSVTIVTYLEVCLIIRSVTIVTLFFSFLKNGWLSYIKITILLLESVTIVTLFVHY